MKRSHTYLPTAPLWGALLLLGGSSGWVGWRTRTVDPHLDAVGREPFGDSGNLRPPLDQPLAVSETPSDDRLWEAPKPQAKGAEWLYELFTPPVIYRQPGSDEFLASVPAAKSPVLSRRHPDFDLLEIRPALFRLQLVGFAGEAGNFFGLFENTVTTEHFLAETGQAIPELGLKIERFRVIREPRRDADAAIAATGLMAEALVRDDVSGEELVLTDRGRMAHGEPAVVIGIHGVPSERFTLRKNEEIEREGVRYRLRDIRLAPPAVELVAESSGGGDADSDAWVLSMAAESGS